MSEGIENVASDLSATEADDDAELLQQLTDVIGQTRECHRSLIARRGSLDACIRHAEELQTHLHGAHTRVLQRIQYLVQALQPDATSSSDSMSVAMRCARRSFEASQPMHFILSCSPAVPNCQFVLWTFVFVCVRMHVRLPY